MGNFSNFSSAQIVSIFSRLISPRSLLRICLLAIISSLFILIYFPYSDNFFRIKTFESSNFPLTGIKLSILYISGHVCRVQSKSSATKLADSYQFSSVPFAPKNLILSLEINLDANKFVINTTFCKIPDFPPWTESTKLLKLKCRKYFQDAPNCEEKHFHSWTYVENSHININLTAVTESGYSWSSIRCCYRVIFRVAKSLHKYDMMVDRRIRYSKKCYPITKPSQLVTEEFIRVFCVSTSVPLINDVVSRDFHAIAQPDKHAKEKIVGWKDTRKKDPSAAVPPNVILLGIDTMSRLNAYRNLKETLSVLNSLKAIEIKGFTKVGETTFPNTVAFLSGYSLRQLIQLCYSDISPQDSCPYLWKAFDKVGYLTATMEDVPLGTAFNFLKTGFLSKPTDFYFRPLMLAVMKYLPREENWYLRCLGKRMIEQVILDYLSDILERASSGAPVFAHVWLAVMAHECSLSAKYADHVLANFLRRVDTDNTVIMFVGDHGEVFGAFRETVQGWYEDKLPTLWVHLPNRLREQFPEWVESLHINSKRLTSHFDMYKTLVHILKTFDKDLKADETYSSLSDKAGQSLFQPVPEWRDCSNASIPEGYCPCSEPASMNVNDPTVAKAANIALQYIIDMLPRQCAVPVMKEILEAKYFVTPKDYKVFIITFTTDPGHFMFEGTVREESAGTEQQPKLVVTNDVLRMNKISRKTNCISQNLLERYCYCK